VHARRCQGHLPLFERDQLVPGIIGLTAHRRTP
jgi:hypothetical protein